MTVPLNSNVLTKAKAVDAGASVWVRLAGRYLTPPWAWDGWGYVPTPHTYAELSGDGHHVGQACDILPQTKELENITAIPLYEAAGGLEDGDYMLGEFPVVVENGTAVWNRQEPGWFDLEA